jgi:hypothetical protein
MGLARGKIDLKAITTNLTPPTILGIVCLLSQFVGCGNRPVYKEQASRLDHLYSDYLNSDLKKAEASMQASIPILESVDFPNPSAKAHGLWLCYSRLQVLASLKGDTANAEAYLLKARYWYLKKYEIEGQPTAEAIDAIRAYDSNRCKEVVTQFDKAHTNGKGARYLLGP